MKMELRQIAGLSLIALAFIVFVFFFVFFLKRGSENKTSKAKKLKTVLLLQREYEKIRKNTRIPCGVLYINTTFINDVKLSQKELSVIESFIFSTFDDQKNFIAKHKDCNYIVLTRLSEAAINLRIEQVIKAISLYYSNRHTQNKIELNFGAYLIPASNVNFDEAVSRTIVACNEAIKEKVPYIAWDYDLQKTHEKQKDVSANINNGIEENNFFLQFQPIVDINTGNIISGEVLTRLNSNDNNIIYPDDFLPVISENGLYEEFDLFVFEKCCKWANINKNLQSVLDFISVNFSRKTLSRPDFNEKFISLMDKYSLPYSFIAIEVLENKSENKISTAIMKSNLIKLREKGIRILLDDFGEGYTTITDLHECPANILKMSNSLVYNTNTDIGVRVFKSILNIASELNALVICEGVEELEQIELLKSCGVRFVQGYYFYKPMNADQFERLLQNNR